MKLTEEQYKRADRLSINERKEQLAINNVILEAKVEEMQKAFATIHGIASETFESCNQLELIRLTAVEHLKGVETK